MSDAPLDTKAVFKGAVTVALQDGHLDDQEMRILARLSHALRLEEGIPVQLYDDIVESKDSGVGREMTRSEALIVPPPFLLNFPRLPRACSRIPISLQIDFET